MRRRAARLPCGVPGERAFFPRVPEKRRTASGQCVFRFSRPHDPVSDASFGRGGLSVGSLDLLRRPLAAAGCAVSVVAFHGRAASGGFPLGFRFFDVAFAPFGLGRASFAPFGFGVASVFGVRPPLAFALGFGMVRSAITFRSPRWRAGMFRRVRPRVTIARRAVESPMRHAERTRRRRAAFALPFSEFPKPFEHLAGVRLHQLATPMLQPFHFAPQIEHPLAEFPSRLV